MPARTLLVAWPVFTARWIRQAEPFHLIASAVPVPEALVEVPTAVQALALGQDTSVSWLTRAWGTLGERRIRHPFPSHLSASVATPEGV
jgi:hypothetical protein